MLLFVAVVVVIGVVAVTAVAVGRELRRYPALALEFFSGSLRWTALDDS